MATTFKGRCNATLLTAKDSLEQAIQQIDEAIGTTRTLVRQVVPQVLYEQGLIPALQWLSQKMANRHGLNVHVNAEDPEPRLNRKPKGRCLIVCTRCSLTSSSTPPSMRRRFHY